MTRREIRLMKTLYGLLLCLMLAGCQAPKTDRDNTQVVVEGGGAFPTSLAGRWQADRHGWEMVIEPDGRIASVVLSLGKVEVTGGAKTTVPTMGGGQGTFEPGKWTVYYEPAMKQLTVKITMNHVRVEMAGNVLEGKSTDTFSGPISGPDGIWQAHWSAFTQYKVRTDQGDETDLSTDPTYGETQALVFRKTPQE
jgi:hypothetical protein